MNVRPSDSQCWGRASALPFSGIGGAGIRKAIVLTFFSVLLVACGSEVPIPDISAIQTQAAEQVLAILSPEPTLTSTPQVVPTATPEERFTTIVCVVQSGDTLFGIAALYGTTAEAICAFNQLPDCSLIYPGDELQIPVEGTVLPSPTLIPTDTPTPTVEAEVAQVIRVIDGDTIEVELDGVTYSVHYIGMNTPEMDEFCGPEAKDVNASLVEGQEVMLVKDISETDRYDRLLRYVHVGDIFVNAELVKLGYASAATYPPDVRYSDLFVQLEREAREAGRGCWATPQPTVTPHTCTATVPKQ